MSTNEKSFIKSFGVIAGALVISFIIGGVMMFRAVGVLANVSNNNAREIQEVKEYHIRDMESSYDYMREMREDQKVMKQDIKEILKEIK